MIYRTGRTATWTFSGSFNGYIDDNDPIRNIAPIIAIDIEARGGAYPPFASVVLDNRHIRTSSHPNYEIGRRIQCTLLSQSGENGVYEWYRVPVRYTHTSNVSWELNLPVEECVDIQETALSDPDKRKKVTVRQFWRLRVGQQATFTATLSSSGTALVSLQHTIGSNETYECSGQVQLVSHAHYYHEDATGSVSHQHSVSQSPLPLSNPQYDTTITRQGWTERLQATNAGQTLTVSTSSIGVWAESNATVTRYPDRQYNLVGRLAALNADYTDSCKVQLRAKYQTDVLIDVGSTGSFTYSGSQKRYQISWSQNTNVNEYSPIYGSLYNPDSIPEQGNAARLEFRLWRWDGIQLAFASTNTIAQTNALTGLATWTAQNATLSIQGGRLRIDTASSGTPKVTATFATNRYLRSYRWWRLYVQASQANSPITLTAGSKQWTFTAGTTEQEWWIDTVMPQNSTALSDGKLSDYDETESELWGIHRRNSVEFTLATGRTYYLRDFVQIVRDTLHYPVVSFADSYGYWIENKRRFLWADCEGRQGIELSDIVNNSEVSIASLVNEITSTDDTYARYPGWDAISLQPESGSSDALFYGYLNENRWCRYLGGAGLEYTGTNWVMHVHEYVQPGNWYPIAAQFLADEVEFTGPAGCWGWGDTGSSVKLALGCVLRSGSFGVVYTATRTPAANANVNLYQQSPARLASSDTSDASGCYRHEQSPMAIGGRDAMTLHGDTSVTRTHYSRTSLRAVLVAGIPANFLCLDVGVNWQRAVRGYISPTGKLVVGIGLSVPPRTGSWLDTATNEVTERACIRWTRALPNAMLIGAIERNNTVYLYHLTEDGGATQLFTIGSGRFPAMVAFPDGRVAVYRWVSGGAIKGIIYDAQLNVLVPEFTAVASGVQEDAIDADYFAEGAYAGVLLLYRNPSGQIVAVYASDGITFS